MRAVRTRDLRNRLGRYLGLVGKGETILVTCRGKPVALLVPHGPIRAEPVELEEVLQQLEAEGHLRRGTQPFKRFRPIRIKGKPVSQMLLENRD